MPYKSRRPDPKEYTQLSDFLKQAIADMGVSMRTAAAGMGISASHLSRIISGERAADAAICNAIAQYFDVPIFTIYNLAGWLNLDADQELAIEMIEALKRDPDKADLVRAVLQIKDPEERNNLLRILRSGLGQY